MTKLNHHVSSDGLTLTSSAETPRGTWNAILRWGTREEAAEHLATAIAGNEELFAKTAETMRVGEGHRVKWLPFGFAFYVGSGPPIWKYPRVEWKRNGSDVEAMVGWLYRCYSLRIPRPRFPREMTR